ncbi:MAG: hypothetical protein Ct9H300mP25_16320 [Acidobacteriota bacterium]|nr:MAG: hypothetical protein Ct9H300mP25_16320 [Acidobacteriota bacterium]
MQGEQHGIDGDSAISMAYANVQLRHMLGFEVGIRNIEPVTRPLARRPEIEDVGCAKTEPEVCHELGRIIEVVQPARSALRSC